MVLAHVAQLAERVLGKDEVTSSILVVGSMFHGVGEPAIAQSRRPPKAVYKSGLAGGPDAKEKRGSNSVARVTAFQAVGRGFESRLPLLFEVSSGFGV